MPIFPSTIGAWHPAAARVITFRHTWTIEIASLENGSKTSPLFAADGYINRKFQMKLMKTPMGVAMKMRGEPSTVPGPVDYRWKCFLLNPDGESFCAIEMQCGRTVQLFEDDPASFEIKNDILQSFQIHDTLNLICEIYMTVNEEDVKLDNVSNPNRVIQFIKNGSTYKELIPVEMAVCQEDKLQTCKHQEELTKLIDQLDMICKTIQPLVSAHRENLKNMDHEHNSLPGSTVSNLVETLEHITAIGNNSTNKGNHNESTNHEEASSSTPQMENVYHISRMSNYAESSHEEATSSTHHLENVHPISLLSENLSIGEDTNAVSDIATDPETHQPSPNDDMIQRLLLGISSELCSFKVINEEQSELTSEDDEDKPQSVYDRSIIREMFEFIQTGKSSNIDQLILNIIEATVKYDLTHLRIICESILLERSLNADSVVPTLILADRIGSKKLKKRAIEFIRANIFTVVYKENYSDINHRLAADIFQNYKP